MKHHLKPDQGIMCLALLIAIATIAIAGCVDSGQTRQSQVTPAGNQQNESPAVATTVMTKITTAPAPLKTVQPAPAPGLSTAGIEINPIGDKRIGDQFLLTGTTSLPAGTEVLWQILPDTGTPPAGLDGNSMMSVGGNNQVIKGDGTTNRISQAVDLGRLVPGKYVVIVGEKKGEYSDFRIGERYGYTYFTLKQR
jgi:hypothetical protein